MRRQRPSDPSSPSRPQARHRHRKSHSRAGTIAIVTVAVVLVLAGTVGFGAFLHWWDLPELVVAEGGQSPASDPAGPAEAAAGVKDIPSATVPEDAGGASATKSHSPSATPTRASPTPTPSSTPTRAKPTSTPSPTSEPTTSEPSPDPSPSPSKPPPRSGNSAYEDEVVRLSNEERKDAGCQPLRADDRLRAAARGHSDDMAERGYFDHNSPDGSTPWDRMRAEGYDDPGGENIARGYPTPKDVVRGWMKSEGHRKNILNCDFKAVGVGVNTSDSGPWWTQDFGYS